MNAYIDKATLAGELEEGIAKGQFKVYFQPVVDVKTGKIASAESLIRWFHPKKGFIFAGCIYSCTGGKRTYFRTGSVCAGFG